jgi:hypothetical protein
LAHEAEVADGGGGALARSALSAGHALGCH